MKIVVGASPTLHTTQDEWRSLTQSELDITDARSWGRLFRPDSLDAILADHVLEHVTLEQGYVAARLAFRYLKHGGYFRIAVPDGYHPSVAYYEWVRPGGTGEQFLNFMRTPDELIHKVLYDYRRLTALLQTAGFNVRLLEWFDESGVLNYDRWSAAQGRINLAYGRGWSPLLSFFVGASYTSLIVDAIKP